MTAAALILAAGSSSRMGQSKQLLEIGGDRLLIKTVKTILQSGIINVTVVLGSNEPAHRKVIENLPADTIYNPEWKKGIGSSIKRGVAHLTKTHPTVPDAIIILVCDQPLLRPEHIQNLSRKYKEAGKPIVASRYLNMPGVPALFDKTYYKQLLALPDDEGAKKILLQNQHDVWETDFPEGAIDIDTPDDYDAFLRGESGLRI